MIFLLWHTHRFHSIIFWLYDIAIFHVVNISLTITLYGTQARPFWADRQVIWRFV
ncbi:hypothetical protein XNA1_3090009 [Xenorhabdus nematophila str. Anatoliense]|nr:hypothetical protein XNA1_3090009 [Xenorhabdus nematophila str. Anatoliense]